MFGAPFPGGSITIGSLNTAVNAALSGTFTAPTNTAVIAIVFGWQDIGVGAFTSATIGGHAATIVVTEFSGGECVAIAAALVAPGDPNTFSCVGPSVFSARCAAFVYEIDGLTRVNSTSSNIGSGTTSAACTVTIAADSCVIAGASAHGAATPGPSWSGITADTSYGPSQHSNSCAHDNYLLAGGSPTLTANMAGAAVTAMAAAVFSP